MAEDGSFEAAANQAYRRASHWGGVYVVLRLANGKHIARGRTTKPEAGATAIGRVLSTSADQLTWEWADGRDAAPPRSPFDRPEPLQRPYWSMDALAPASRRLMDLMAHVMAIQRCYYAGRKMDAARLLQSAPPAQPGDAAVPYPQYLSRIEALGMVEHEQERLNATIALARDALEPVLIADTGKSEAIIFGRTNVGRGDEPDLMIGCA